MDSGVFFALCMCMNVACIELYFNHWIWSNLCKMNVCCGDVRVRKYSMYCDNRTVETPESISNLFFFFKSNIAHWTESLNIGTLNNGNNRNWIWWMKGCSRSLEILLWTILYCMSYWLCKTPTSFGMSRPTHKTLDNDKNLTVCIQMIYFIVLSPMIKKYIVTNPLEKNWFGGSSIIMMFSWSHHTYCDYMPCAIEF